MAPSTAKGTQGSFSPSNDPATHRDLLLFEERLKTNVASLNRRKRRYQLFLAQLLLLIAFLLSEVVLHTRLLLVPHQFVLRSVLPNVHTDDIDTDLHTYLASGLFVSVTTLVLFFASGTYSEKIGYANRRRSGPRSPSTRSPSSSPAPQAARPRRAAPARPSPSRSRGASKRTSSVPIPPIPPASNPRGELIFSSRVDRAFRESYERYCAAFERRREERERAAYARRWAGWLYLKMPWARRPPALSNAAPVPGVGSRAGDRGR
ncbi:hypothetical protein B0H21DRAFT_824367 [Amylocystis lapponica]|nr:hypothetical protein B0H21DRAFT_824367 [Amylocystis lapponica]